jgi:hypothetical protein
MPLVVKGDSTTEEFQRDKLERSLRHAGASAEVAEDIAWKIAAQVRDGMTTTAIYRDAFKLLHRSERVSAARYSMRRAILDLGPTGYPFEDYVSELMRANGYEVKTRVIMKGKCAEHEVDIVMKKNGKTIGAELKFHNTPGFKTDLKTALYVKARFDDIGADVDEGWLITNTKFTDNVLHYAACAGITLLGWNHPRGHGLAELIQGSGLYPITVLTELTRAEKERLLMNSVPLCRTIAERPEVLAAADIPESKRQRVISQSAALCGVK